MQTLVAYVENKPGVLNRVSSLARRLAINIDSLTVGPTQNEEIARITILAHTDEKGAHRLETSLDKHAYEVFPAGLQADRGLFVSVGVDGDEGDPLVFCRVDGT